MFPRVIPLVQPGCLCLTHPFATHHRSDAFDLHVLGTPPAFILSQDQTLHDSLFTIKVVFLWLFFVFWLVFLFFSFFLSFDRNCLTCSVQFSMVSAAPDWTACLYYHVLSPLTSLFLLFFTFFSFLSSSVVILLYYYPHLFFYAKKYLINFRYFIGSHSSLKLW